MNYLLAFMAVITVFSLMMNVIVLWFLASVYTGTVTLG